jgi:hypothetical protein
MNLYQRYPRSSSFYAYSNCDISFELMRAAGEEPPTIFSDRGSEVHALIAGKLECALGGDAEVELATELDLQDKELARRLYFASELDEEHIEERLWLRNGLLPVYSGQPDRWRLYQNRTKVYLPDFKTGWHPFDHYVATNCQIRSYVPLVDEACGRKLEAVTAAIHKPGKKTPPAVFGRAEIEEAKAWSLEVVKKITGPGPKSPTRGPWCTYCSGKVLCPAWRNEIETLAPLAEAVLGDIPDLVLRDLAPRLDLAATVIEKLKARLKARVKDRPDLFPGWGFADGDPKRSIEPERNGKVFDVLVTGQAALTFNDFLACGRLAVTSLEDAIRKNKRISASAARELMNAKLSGIMEKKLPEPHLVYNPVTPETHEPTPAALEAGPRRPLPAEREKEAREAPPLPTLFELAGKA